MDRGHSGAGQPSTTRYHCCGPARDKGESEIAQTCQELRAATGDERYRAAMDLETKDLKDMLRNSSVKAVHMLATEPVVFAFGLWIAFAWFVTFLFLSVIPITFQEKRRWSEGVAGLPYISLCIGVMIDLAPTSFKFASTVRS